MSSKHTATSISIFNIAAFEWPKVGIIILKLCIPAMTICFALGGLLILPASIDAKIYKYKKNGVWVYTDTASEDMPADRQELIESNEAALQKTAPMGSLLLVDYPAANTIEKAAACTVTIESALGSGSGFFISSKGHIITNKHVIRSSAKQAERTQSHIVRMEAQITQRSTRLSKEKQRLLNFKVQLEHLKTIIKSEPSATRRKTYQANYDAKQSQYQQWKDDFDHRQTRFESEKNRFETKRSDFDYARIVTDLSQSFSITLADNTRHYARVLKISTTHDLALLKIDGYQTPTLSPVSEQAITQGAPVYAIGNPARLKNSVTSGIFSGYENGFVKTDARIYPGNSGGPLVIETGQVIGINTFKKLTHKFEGLGFAIPIWRAIDEFSSYLP